MNLMETMMPWETSVLKYLWIFITLTSNVLYCQDLKLRGSYDALIGEHYSTHTFTEKGTFDYHKGSSLGDSYYGSGHYKVTEGCLILDYDSTAPAKTSLVETNIWTNESDSILVRIKVNEENQRPLYGAKIEIESFNRKLMTDKNGFVEIKFLKSKSSKPLKGKLIYMGYYNGYFTFDSNTNCLLKINLQKHNGVPILNTVDTLEIVKQTNEFLKLKKSDGQELYWKKSDS